MVQNILSPTFFLSRWLCAKVGVCLLIILLGGQCVEKAISLQGAKSDALLRVTFLHQDIYYVHVIIIAHLPSGGRYCFHLHLSVCLLCVCPFVTKISGERIGIFQYPFTGEDPHIRGRTN